MLSNSVLVFYYNYENRYGINALTGAIDTDEYFNNLPVLFYKTGEEIIKNIAHLAGSYEKVIIAVSFFTTQLWDINDFIKKIRNYDYKNVILIAGGPHPSGDPFGTIKIGFDIAVQGEGEETLIEFLKKIDKNEDYYDIEGITFKKNNDFLSNRRTTLIDLDKYPPYSMKYEKSGSFELSRGCDNICCYCQTPRIFTNNVRYRSIKKVCEYLVELQKIDYYDARFIITDAFNYRPVPGKGSMIKKFLMELSKAIYPKGKIYLGNFPSEIRPESVNEQNLELILKYCSNKAIIIGAQSGSPRLLDLCKRNHSVEDIHKAVTLSIKAGLQVNIDLIFGLPGENDEDRDYTINLIYKFADMGAKIHAHTFIPLPSTPYWNRESGKLYSNTMKALNKLVYKGLVYGSWLKQAELNEKIYNYINNGIL